MDKNISLLISLLRVPLIFLVITMHIHGIDSKITECFVVFFSRAGVPVFFIISGFLFFINKQDFSIKIKKRIKTLVIPFYAWNILFIAFYLILAHLGFLGQNNPYNNKSAWDIFVLASGVEVGLSNGTMWYIRSLFIICCLSPLIAFALKKIPAFFLIFSMLLYILTRYSYLEELAYPLMISQPLAFFSFGAYIAVNKFSLEDIFSAKKTIFALIVFIVLLSAWFLSSNKNVSSFISQIGTLCVIYLIVNFAHNLIKRGITTPEKSLLLESTFFIFAFHMLLTPHFNKINVNIISKYGEVVKFMAFIGEAVAVFAVSFVLFYISKKLCPKVLSFINGR